MIVSDGTIREMLLTGYLSISPLEPDQIQPASVDVRLSNHFQRFDRLDRWGAPTNYGNWEVDPKKDTRNLTQAVVVLPPGQFILRPGEFALGSTEESVRLPADLVARVEGKSSLARLGLAVHATAGFIDPGFEGQVTLEFSNLSPYSIRLTPGMRIAQLSFQFMDAVAERPYGHEGLNSKYQGQRGATPSAYHLND